MSVYANKCLPMPPPFAVYIFWWNENLRFKLNKFPRDLPRIHFGPNMILKFSLSCEIVNEIFNGNRSIQCRVRLYVKIDF